VIGELTKDLLINKKFNLNDINFLFDQVTIVNHTPIVGINGPNNNCNGWNRSIVSALKLRRNYNYIIHNEYDLRIQNLYRFTPYINQSGFYCAFCYGSNSSYSSSHYASSDDSSFLA
jgi:hypothetical protein